MALHHARPAGRLVGDHWDAPDALWPANGQNQEGARELREAVAQSTVYPSGFRMGAGRLAVNGDGRSKERGRLVCISTSTPILARIAAALPGARRLWVTTLRTSSAL